MDAIKKLVELEKYARFSLGFDWPDKDMIIEQVIDECREIREAISMKETPERVQEEIGDLIHAAVSLCHFANFDVEETICLVNAKFSNRIDTLEFLTKKNNLETLKGQTLDFKLKLWQEAKKLLEKK